MSVKLYGGRIRRMGITNIHAWQLNLQKAADQMTQAARLFAYDFVFNQAVRRADLLACGMPFHGEFPCAPDQAAFQDPANALSPFSAACELYQKRVENLKKGTRDPLTDRSMELCWHMQIDGSILVILYGERDQKAMATKLLGLDDYHYQNQSDPSEDCSKQEWAERGTAWSTLLDGWNAAPAARMSTFQLAPPPEFLIWWKGHHPENLTCDTLPERLHQLATERIHLEHPLPKKDGETIGDFVGNMGAHITDIKSRTKPGGDLQNRWLEILVDCNERIPAEPSLEWVKTRRAAPTVGPTALDAALDEIEKSKDSS